MTGEPSGPDEAFYRDASRVLGQLAMAAGARVDALDELAEQIEMSNATLARIEKSLSQFAIAADVSRRRTLAQVRLLFLIVWVAIALMGAVTLKVESCSPGTRAERAARILLETPLDLERIKKAVAEPAPLVCDPMFPLAAHDVGASWPAPGNMLGLGLYGVLAVVTLVAVRHRSWESGDAEDLRATEDDEIDDGDDVVLTG